MNVADSLPFASGDALEGRQSDSVLPHDFTRDTNDLAASHRESMYTTLLHELITTVVKHESFLFFPPELELLQELNTLSYPARYLLVRLSLRTRSKLHRLSDLTVKYTSELGPHLPHCIDELCHASLSRPSVIQNDGNMAINAKAEAGHHASEMVSSSKTKMEFDADVFAAGTKERNAVDINQIRPCFARDESSASTEELLNTLKWDEMKKLGVEMKIFRTGMNRETLKSALLDTALKQTTLPLSLFTRIPPRPSKRDSTPPPQSTVVGSKIIINLVSPSIKKQQPGTRNQLIRLRQMILSFETKFIRVSEEMFTLLQRLNLVYFRCTALSSNSILLPLILARSKKRQYPVYEATRTTNVFISRDALIRYEKALRVEDELDKVPDHGSLNRFERAEKVLEIFQTIYNKWKDLANGKESREQRLQNHPGLERFEEGHVLTRIVHKGAQALGHLKRYKEEVHVLRTLLGQETWRKGGRGEWYDRLALVLMRHLKEPQQAMGVLVTALNDPHTHIVCRPRLIRRLAGVEKILKIPSDQCTKCDDVLRKAKITIVQGTRVSPRKRFKSPSSTPLVSGENLGSFATSRSPFEAHRESEMVHPVGPQTGQHSLWVGMNEEVGVEELALEHYATLGFRGFHSEGRIVHHLFLLLFWSIVFLPIPGAFETSYQIAPLDLGHDSFYHARQAEIQQRLQEIKDGEGPRILEEVDDRERPRKTFAIGARWEQFTKEDTLEIVKSIGGNALALICQVVAQDYSHRSSGVPDLLLWNVRAGKAKFVEVKGPGDVLMETQKVWIDVLLNCGMDVEVCHVREDDETDKPKGRRQSQKGSKQKSKAVDTYNANLGPDESNQDDYQHTAGDGHNISGSPQNPLVIPDGEANDCPPRHPSNRKRSRIDYESLVSGGSDAKRKRPSSSKL